MRNDDCLTAWRGSTLATWRASFMASIEGFKRTGNSSGRVAFERFGFIVSKQIIWSKQSVISSRFRHVIAWFLSELVKIWRKLKKKMKLATSLINWFIKDYSGNTAHNNYDYHIVVDDVQSFSGWCCIRGCVVEDLVWSNHTAIFRARNWWSKGGKIWIKKQIN